MSFKHLLALCLTGLALAREQPSKGQRFPYPERLSYRIEWRLVTAGTATVQLSRPSPDHWQLELNLESAGVVNRLYRVVDKYTLISYERFCPSTLVLDAQEGKRHRFIRLTFQNSRHQVQYEERDLINNRTSERVLDIAPCTHDIAGALAAVRLMNIEPGQSATLPITDGKKMVNARIEAKSRENVTNAGKTYHTIRYEAFLFDNLLYRRKGRLFIWLTDDADRIPVQLRFQMGFPIGTISVELEKQQKL
ncbi:MAG: DUF3108 domain-containing protein [Bryobacteraceae bacterium]